MLSGDGNYNLNSLKEISVTESFYDLDDSVKDCQDLEPYDECTTRYYKEINKKKCGCFPFPLSYQEQVKTSFDNNFMYLRRSLSAQHQKNYLAVRGLIKQTRHLV